MSMQLKAIDVARLRRSGVRPLRGDAVGCIARGGLFRVANARVYITGVAAAAAVPTRDTADRAHATFDSAGYLVPATGVEHARPRRYHISQMTSRGVAVDSSFDSTHRLRQELSGIPGIGIEAARRDAAVLCRDARTPARPT